ncbi:zonular occludens toxin domain-containing protein [Kineobactrum salinum]|uniref:Zona occludens toxin N-terminal domain-containing protein n=1 Tax=Kineobactrum salinum TaxID=2708301 RepID=A0A6C0TZC8_9GAMM|nr:zonular occludens toxin domain-containing protein [Kineobactrum salinum]QIB64057.1 hypothetical protein G3T16_00055 [Kineobactrum salinum]
MAITAYSGLPGSGKSYSVVEHVILPALRAGNIVWTNIPMDPDLMDSEFGGLLKQFKISEIEENQNWFQETFTPGATIVIDEAWRLWPAGLALTQCWNSTSRSLLNIGIWSRKTVAVLKLS